MGLLKYLEKTHPTANSSKHFEVFLKEKFSESRSVGIRNGYNFLWKVYERGTFSIKNGI